MSRPSRIYCRVIGCLSPDHVQVAISGSPGVAEGSFSPQPTIRVPMQQVPPDKRFPNSVVWFDVAGDQFIYVEPDKDGLPVLPANIDQLKTQLEQLATARKANPTDDPKDVAPRFGRR